MSSAIGNTVAYIPPQQAPLLNTAILGSQTTRVAADNVAPPVSNAQVDNNAKGNGSYSAVPAAPAASGETSGAFNVPSTSAQPPSVSAPSAFLAQLLAQNTSSDDSITQSLLVGYERLVALSNVKYKPSNALKPLDGPSSVFGRLLQQEQPQAQIEPAAPPAVATTTDIAPAPAATTTDALPADITISADVIPQGDTLPTPVNENAAAASVPSGTADTQPQNAPAPSSFVLPGVSAYVTTSTRNDATITPPSDNSNSAADEQSLPSLV